MQLICGGQDLIEYALLNAFIALASTSALNTVSTNITRAFTYLEKTPNSDNAP
jgi:Flp pilus assembly pilin Flp